MDDELRDALVEKDRRNAIVREYLESYTPKDAGWTARRCASSVAYYTAEAVKAGMEGEELHGYIQGLSVMAGESVKKRAEYITRGFLEWGEAMTLRGRHLPLNEFVHLKN